MQGKEYQELISKCKQAYKEHDLRLAYTYWVQMHEILSKKIEDVENIKDLSSAELELKKRDIYFEFFDCMEQFSNNEVYDITDWGKKIEYSREVRDRYENISLSTLVNDKTLKILEDFCDFYEWLPVKIGSSYNILDLQLDELVEEEDYQTPKELVNRIVGKAIDYFRDEEDWDDNIEDGIKYGLKLYDIASKYKLDTKEEESWLNGFKQELEEW